MLPTRNTVLAGDAPFLLWSGGKTYSRTPGKGIFTTFVGFHSELGRYEQFDLACKKAGIAQIEVRHQDQKIKEYWSFGTDLLLYPITSGPVAARVGKCVEGGNAELTTAAGIGAAQFYNEEGKYRTKAAVRAIMAVLVDVGYVAPVQWTANGMMSDYLLAALVDHVRVCELADKEMGQDIFPADLALPLAPGPEASFGKGATSTTMVPYASQHPKKIDAAYLKGLYRPNGVREAVEALWESTVSWAKEYGAPRVGQLVDGAQGAAAVTVTPETIEQEITMAMSEERVEELRQYSLNLRDTRDITMGEQMRVAGLCDERLEALAY